MNTPIRHQIIEDKGQPLFVLVPYAEYVASLNRQPGKNAVIPLAVSKAANLEDKSLARAWREYKGLSQAEMARRMGISRPAHAQLEAKGANLRATSLHRLAAALDVQWEQHGIVAHFHRPHPQPDTNKGAVKSVRRFLESAGVTP